MKLWFVIFSYSLHSNILFTYLFIIIIIIIITAYVIFTILWEKENLCYCVTFLFRDTIFVIFWWIKWPRNHLFLLWTILESMEKYLKEISYWNKSVKKRVSVWHVKNLHVLSLWFKMPGRLPHISFRMSYQVV